MSLSKCETDACLSSDKPCLSSIFERNDIRYLCKPKIFKGTFDAVERSTTNESKMNYEKFRLESFKGWPIPWISPREMAANGFYFNKILEDVVECNFCHIKLYCWEAEDVPAEQHERWAPFCPFIKGEQTKNVPIINKKTIIYKCLDELNGSGSHTTTV